MEVDTQEVRCPVRCWCILEKYEEFFQCWESLRIRYRFQWLVVFPLKMWLLLFNLGFLCVRLCSKTRFFWYGFLKGSEQTVGSGSLIKRHDSRIRANILQIRNNEFFAVSSSLRAATILLGSVMLLPGHIRFRKFGTLHPARYSHGFPRSASGNSSASYVKFVVGLHVTWCTQLYSLAETPQPPPPPAFGLVYEGAIGQPR